MTRVLDLFAGTGWGVACQALGLEEHGVELMPAAIATREANGMRTAFHDVWEGLRDPSLVPEHDVLIASPPCQTFSVAGAGAGRRALDEVIALIDSGAWIDPDELQAFGAQHDDRTALVLTPLTYAMRYRPRVIVLEQVPTVIPVWHAIARVLRHNGYQAEAAVLNAEQYGVPQTRKRAILVAVQGGPARLPTPTHSRYYPRDPQRLDEGVLPWVSMAEALGWGMTQRPYLTVAPGTAGGGTDPAALGGSGARATLHGERDAGRWEQPGAVAEVVGFPRRVRPHLNEPAIELNGEAYRAISVRSTDLPSQVVTGKARSWQRWRLQSTPIGDLPNRPAHTITGSRRSSEGTIIGRQLPEGERQDVGGWPRMAGAGASDKAGGGRQRSRDATEPAHTITGAGSAAWVPSEADPADVVHHHSGDWPSSAPRTADQPSRTVTSKVDRHTWVPNTDAEAVKAAVAERINDQSGTAYDPTWPANRPATVVAGRELVQNPGATGNRFNGSTKSRNDGIRVTLAEAAALQSYPEGFTWVGTSTACFQQVGNAVPPLLALRVLEALGLGDTE